MKSTIIIIFFLMSVFNLWADEELTPYPYVTASAGGRYYFKMIPTKGYGYKGKGILYSVSSKGSDKIKWKINGWYAFRVYISYDGTYLIRFGNWPRGRGPSHKHLGIAFYKNAKLIKIYSTKDLIKDSSAIEQSISHYKYLDKVLGFESIYSHRFKLRTTDKIEYTFDVTNGKIVSQKKVK